MKQNKKAAHKQRLILDSKLDKWKKVFLDKAPGSGWVKSIRESLGMTAAQLAKRLKTSQSSVAQLESREKVKKATLETLDRAAEALGCRLVYALIPEKEKTIQKLLDHQIQKFVNRQMKKVSHSMSLENQELTRKEEAIESYRLRKELLNTLNSQIWDEEK